MIIIIDNIDIKLNSPCVIYDTPVLVAAVPVLRHIPIEGVCSYILHPGANGRDVVKPGGAMAAWPVLWVRRSGEDARARFALAMVLSHQWRI